VNERGVQREIDDGVPNEVPGCRPWNDKNTGDRVAQDGAQGNDIARSQSAEPNAKKDGTDIK
jgi:hypothetical protein